LKYFIYKRCKQGSFGEEVIRNVYLSDSDYIKLSGRVKIIDKVEESVKYYGFEVISEDEFKNSLEVDEQHLRAHYYFAFTVSTGIL